MWVLYGCLVLVLIGVALEVVDRMNRKKYLPIKSNNMEFKQWKYICNIIKLRKKNLERKLIFLTDNFKERDWFDLKAAKRNNLKQEEIFNPKIKRYFELTDELEKVLKMYEKFIIDELYDQKDIHRLNDMLQKF
jgi:hypothetical protein